MFPGVLKGGRKQRIGVPWLCVFIACNFWTRKNLKNITGLIMKLLIVICLNTREMFLLVNLEVLIHFNHESITNEVFFSFSYFY